jgi:shikimate dehydrogenase
VVGNPVAHSRSPFIHTAFARQTGQAMRYEALLAPLDGFVATQDEFRAHGGKGVNVTTPFKLEAFALTAAATPRARAAGAVNTLAWRDGAWMGDTTDGVGLARDIESNRGFALSGKDILLLGAGGAARGVVGALLAAHPRLLAIANRTASKAQALAAAFAKDGPTACMAFEQFEDAVFDLVIDATSASLTDEETLRLPPVQLRQGALAYELAYGKADTPFCRWARECGASVYADGLGMLVEQAAESFHWWRGVRPDTAPVLAQLRAS